MDAPPTDATTNQRKRRWFEPVEAVLMAMATLSTAWCSYQSSCWSGESNALETRADKLERAAAAMHLEGLQVEAIQARSVMEVVDAQFEGDERRARFYTDRFADELKPAYEKWLALKPFENASVAPDPFARELYTPRFTGEIRVAKAGAALAEAESNETGHHASAYLSNTVLLASVLFFSGAAGKFDQRRVRLGSLIFASAIFLYAAVRMVLLPIA
jgi:hypothetical protein